MKAIFLLPRRYFLVLKYYSIEEVPLMLMCAGDIHEEVK